MIKVDNIIKHFPIKEGLLFSTYSLFRNRPRRFIRAVNGVSFNMNAGDIFGIAGESGCGKTTTGMLMLRLYTPTSGSIFFKGNNISKLRGVELSKFRSSAQLVFQDPYESLNPRFNALRTIEEPLLVTKSFKKAERLDRVVQAMERSKLLPISSFLKKYPHELSGGERQRVCIARAVVLEPKLLVADEAVSMLDVSIRAGILRLIRDLTVRLNMATLYISHDISLLGSICNKIAIMYAGKIVEMGNPQKIIKSPQHPYTKALIAAVPTPEFVKHKGPILSLEGEPPDLTKEISGCSFYDRCTKAVNKCKYYKSELKEIIDGHFVACHYSEDTQ
jgi:peptide/nickel transport system ATP-binding protein